MATHIGMPSGGGIMDATKAGLYGAGAALVYNFVSGYLGNSLLGALAGIAIAGSVVKGEQGKIVATLLGFQLVQSGTLSLGSFSGNQSQSQSDEAGVI